MPGRPWTLLPTPGAERHQGGSAPFSRLYGSRRRAGTDVFFMQKEEEKMKKRALSLLMALVMVVSLLPATARAADSTLNGDISVGTAAELEALGGKDIEGNITLTANIDMSNTKMTPIKSLKGCFNGDGKTISGLALEGGNDSNTGLIGQLDGSVINLKMTDASITGIGNRNNAGILVGFIPQGSTSKIDNCCIAAPSPARQAARHISAAWLVNWGSPARLRSLLRTASATYS